jgi:hypothetical protein
MGKVVKIGKYPEQRIVSLWKKEMCVSKNREAATLASNNARPKLCRAE